MNFLNIINVTDQPIDISGLSEAQIAYYRSLSDELSAQYKELGRGRQLFTLSGPGGAGKSVITTLFEYLFEDNPDFHFLNVGLDAFHYPNKVLAERDRLAVKGRYDTYDTNLLFEKMSAFKAGKPVSFPYYSREHHNPVPDSIEAKNEDMLLLLEGQWLLKDMPEWQNIRDLSSLNLYVEGSLEAMRHNVISRHMRGGRSAEEAATFYNSSDHKNTEDIQNNRVQPDKIIKFYKDI